MKRSAGLQRHKPLVGNLETYLAWQRRSQQAAIQRAQQAPSRPKDTGPSRKTRGLIRKRAKNRCEVTGTWLGPKAGHIHHRRPRRIGGDPRPDANQSQNLLLVSPGAHDWIENNRAEAHRVGLLLHDKQDPLTEPVVCIHGRVLLDDHGDWTAAEETTTSPRGTSAA